MDSATSPKELEGIQPLRGTDFYQADARFRSLLEQLVPPEHRCALEKKLQNFSGFVSDRWDRLAEEAAHDYLGPKIESYDFQGHPIDEVWLPPPIRTLRREVVEAGIFENDSQFEQLAKTYLLSHLGEISVVCPLACTAGLIRVIQAVGSDFLQEIYLPQLLSAKTPLAGAQFITEKDMGSDVGALTTVAKPAGEGKWQLFGEKWFCSAIDEFFLIAARPEGAPEGTRGVAIFFVPRMIDGRLNDLRIKRLKNKIGTQELPTAEIDLNGALAYNIGPIEQGFKNLMSYVINTSRLMNAASGSGVMARAWLEASSYTRQRSAFGKKIASYPLVQESLNKIEAILSARRALFFRTVARGDENPLTDLGSDEAFAQRFLINLCKYRTSIGASECTHEAILLFGGNGTIEDFSILPRLYRDSLVIETWEGSHNTLALQVCRDGLRFPFAEFLDEFIQKDVEALRSEQKTEVAQGMTEWWGGLRPALERLNDPDWVAHQARHFLDQVGALLETIQLTKTTPSDSPLVAWYRHEYKPQSLL